jgi:asparagine synthase (glutamine-hydrolysing)
MALLAPVARRVRRDGLTHVAPAQLAVLRRAVRRIDILKTQGAIVECGVGLGGAAIVLATSMGEDRAFHGYDTFGPFSPQGEDGQADLHDRVSASLGAFGVPVDETRVTLHRGRFEDTLHPAQPIALAHIDADSCEPVGLCLERIWPHLSLGGLLVIDGYQEYEDCREAVEEFLAGAERASPYRRVPSAVLEKY